MITAKVGESTYRFNNELEQYFAKIKKDIIGDNQTFSTLYGQQKILYADWTASGRLYKSIEEKISNKLGPYVGNTHTDSNITGTYMTKAYVEAKKLIKKHVNANELDIILFEGFGMTGAVNKLQRLLGLKEVKKESTKKPIVFVTHMEHHSNYLSWIETNAEVCMISPNKNGDVDEYRLLELLNLYGDRDVKIGAFTACSNVTGRKTNYHSLAKIMHQHGGLCFVDFAASAPYVSINMHPNDKLEELDAIFFSPHKFLGGPGTSGVLIMSKNLIQSKVPDIPGGGTVDFTNPWGDLVYKHDVEEREDGGTPGFLQAIKVALCIQLKEKMGINKILERERELVTLALNELSKLDGINVFEKNNYHRLGIISFTIHDIHYDLVVRLLNDRFGIQVRGGCSCAAPYGHYLLNITKEESKILTNEIQQGDFSHKPGWVRLSLHPTMTNEEIYYIISALKKILLNHKEWSKDYYYENRTSTYQANKKIVAVESFYH